MSAQCLRKVLFRLRWAHTLNCIPPLADCLRRVGDDTRKLAVSSDPSGRTLGDRVKAQQQPLKALQQGIVQLARNALALGELCLHATAYLGCDLTDA